MQIEVCLTVSTSKIQALDASYSPYAIELSLTTRSPNPGEP